MFATVTTSQLNTDRMDEALRVYQAQVLPGLLLVDGVQAVTTAANPDTGEVVVMVRWESQTAVATYLRQRRDQLISPLNEFYVREGAGTPKPYPIVIESHK